MKALQPGQLLRSLLMVWQVALEAWKRTARQGVDATPTKVGNLIPAPKSAPKRRGYCRGRLSSPSTVDGCRLQPHASHHHV